MSEFGKGYAYCLGLFLAHEWNAKSLMRRQAEDSQLAYSRASMWFNGAADHLFELEVPEVLPEEKKAQIAAFRDRCIVFTLCAHGETCTFDDVQKALDEAKNLLREWDEFHLIPSEKGDWE